MSHDDAALRALHDLNYPTDERLARDKAALADWFERARAATRPQHSHHDYDDHDGAHAIPRTTRSP